MNNKIKVKKKNKKIFIIFIYIVTFVIFTMFFYKSFNHTNKNDISLNKTIENEKKQEVINKLSLVMVGDSLIHGSVYYDAYKDNKYDFTSMLSEMKPIISSYDLAYYNQETILGGTEIGLSTYPCFNSPYEVGDAFLDAGFNLVSLANNHTLDRGIQAINNSCSYWKSKNAYVSGSYCSEEDRDNVKIYIKNGIKYALLSYTTTTNGIRIPDGKNYLVNVYNPDVVKSDIEKYRDKADLLMVAMHWGEEYTHNIVSEQREIAEYLADLGVDIIIGAHPHVIEPVEFIGNTLVIYSLGNFISAQNGIEKLTGLMVSVDILKKESEDFITLDNVNAELTYTYSNRDKGYRGNYKIYPYSKLNDNLLNNYNGYYQTYMNIVTSKSDKINKRDDNGNN